MVSGYDAKNFLKSANIWQSCSKNKSGPIFFLTQSINEILVTSALVLSCRLHSTCVRTSATVATQWRLFSSTYRNVRCGVSRTRCFRSVYPTHKTTVFHSSHVLLAHSMAGEVVLILLLKIVFTDLVVCVCRTWCYNAWRATNGNLMLHCYLLHTCMQCWEEVEFLITV